MITTCSGLPDPVLDDIAALERRVVDADGGRLKLEWRSLRSRAVQDVLVHDGGRLIGFVGVYRHGGEPELTGMIDPAYRRRGFGTAALTRALELEHDTPAVLLVVPWASAGGHRLAQTVGGVFAHAEHALLQRAAPASCDEPAGLQVRPADEADRGAIRRLLQLGFGDTGDVGDRLAHTSVAELDGQLVAGLVVERQGERAGVYGFVLEPQLRGRGLGRAVLGRVCRELRADGVREVHLEVEVDNERALGLYTSLGFEPVTTEDYYRVPAIT